MALKYYYDGVNDPGIEEADRERTRNMEEPPSLLEAEGGTLFVRRAGYVKQGHTPLSRPTPPPSPSRTSPCE